MNATILRRCVVGRQGPEPWTLGLKVSGLRVRSRPSPFSSRWLHERATPRHYAKWVDREGYREPMRLRTGDVPSDFIGRMAYESPQSPPNEKAAENAASRSPRPLLRKLVELRGIEPLTLRLPVARNHKK